MVIQSAKLKEVSAKTTEILEAFRVGLRALTGADLSDSIKENDSVLKKYNDRIKTTAELVGIEIDGRERIAILVDERIQKQENHSKTLLALSSQTAGVTAKHFDKTKEELLLALKLERIAVEANHVISKKLLLRDQEVVKEERVLQLVQKYNIEIETTLLKYNAVAGVAKEITEEDKKRLIFLEDQIAALGDQVKGYQDIATAARVATSVADVAATKAGLAFSKIEDSLKTRRELIGEGFDKQIAGIDSYAEALKKAGIVDQAELDRVNQARERATSARSEAIEGLAPRATTTTPGKPVARRSTGGGASRGSSAPGGGVSDFESLVSDLKREEVAIAESYLKRLDLVRNNTAVGSVLRAELTERVREEHEKESIALAERAIYDLEISGDYYGSELAKLSEFYERRREIILESTTLTEQEKNSEIGRLENERAQIHRQSQQRRDKESLSAAADLLGGLSDLSSKFGKKGAKVAKALAITQATINAYLGFSNALADPTPMPTPVRWALAGSSLASGLANVISISSQSSGNYAQGGILGGGSSSGDSVTFKGNRGEAILNFEQQKRLLNIANGSAVAGQGGGSGNVTIINQTSRNIDVAEQSVNSNGERQIIIREAANLAKAELVNESETGSGSFVPSLQRNFGLRREGA